MKEALTPSYTVGIYLSDTGGGHRGAADAIQAGLELLFKSGSLEHANIRFYKEAIPEKCHPMTYWMFVMYQYMARHHTTWIKHYYRLLHFFKPESDLYYGLYRPYLHKLLKLHRPSLIVSVHPMLGHCLTRAVSELNMESGTKVAVVVTDPNEWLWHAWACDRADLIIAPNEIVRRRLLSWNIPPEKIQVLGMPIHPSFLSPPTVTREEFLTSLGLSPNVLTVCLNSSWAGNEHWLNIFRALTKCHRKLQVVFLSGHNDALYSAAMRAASETGIPTAVLPFSNRMADLMASVDVMVTKAGGLTSFQALARRLPIIFDKTIEPMPQEAPTLEMLVKLGVAREMKNPDNLIQIIESIDFPPNRQAALPAEDQLDLTDHAVFDICKSLVRLCNPEFGASGDPERSVENIV
jgi:UDP-N-acetylglucosamine:LPS N-acetylglucosamine transferase